MYRFATAAAFALTSLAASSAWAGFEGPSGGPNLGDPSDPFDAFDAIIRVGVGQNDNIQLWADMSSLPELDDTRESTFITATLDTTFRHRINPLFSVGAALRVDGTATLNEIPVALQPQYGEFNNYDRIVINPSLFANVMLGGVDVRFVYGFRFEDAAEERSIGLYGHQIGIELSKDVSATWRIRAGASHAWNDFGIVFADPVNDRDGTLTAFNAGADYYIGGGYTVLSATVNASVNDSDGRNWKYAGYGATLGARTVIIPGLFASGGVGYEHRDYRGFVSPSIPAPDRDEQGIFSANAKLVYAITERFSADVHVVYGSYDSNMPQFEGNQTTVGIGLTTKLF